MTGQSIENNPFAEDLLAKLTQAAYDAALRHGVTGPFIDVELDIWRALRSVMQPRPEEELCSR